MDCTKLQKITESLFKGLVENTEIQNCEFQLQNGISKQQFSAIIETLRSLGLQLKSSESKTFILTKVDLIDAQEIQEKLLKLQISKPIYYSFSTDSTSQQAKKNPQEAIYIADHQKSGYGRNSKQWISPLGQSIALSIKHKFQLELHQLSGLNIAIGVAIMNTLNQFNSKKVGLKWPNDIIGEKGKVAGIIIEATGNTKQAIEVVVGIGINWSIRKELFKTVQQKCMNIDLQFVHRNQFIMQLIIQLEKIFNEFSNNQLCSIIKDWNKYDLYMNQQVKLIYNDSIIYGKYLGIDTSGALQLLKDGNIESIINGEVSLRPATKVD
jgi:BirA family biotin operon repressor/biotin-[acetyl-CoA-carboxylase] ligase